MDEENPSERTPLLSDSSLPQTSPSPAESDHQNNDYQLRNYRRWSAPAPVSSFTHITTADVHVQEHSSFRGLDLDWQSDPDLCVHPQIVGNPDVDPNSCQVFSTSPKARNRSATVPASIHASPEEMDVGILRALNTVKNNPYVRYVGLGLAGLVTQKDQHDPSTGAPLRKSKLQLVRISAAVCGIELCYAAETAFVSPILLKLGVPPTLMTMIWCLSPCLGFFLVPIMGSLSDRCKFRLGRRRPFIIIMSIGIIIGLALVPNGETLGILLGDNGNETINGHGSGKIFHNSTQSNFTSKTGDGISFTIPADHFRGIIFTILGVALLDFNCDACQSPCRAYLLDVSVPEDHYTGLTMFTVMAGAGGTVGYVMGGIDWNSTSFGEALGGHIRVVFSVVLFAFIICVISTLTSFKEVPLSQLHLTSEDIQKKKKKVGKSKYRKFTNEDSSSDESASNEYGSIETGQRHTFYGALSETNAKLTDSKQRSQVRSQFDSSPIGNDQTKSFHSIVPSNAQGKESGRGASPKTNQTNGSVYRPCQNENVSRRPECNGNMGPKSPSNLHDNQNSAADRSKYTGMSDDLSALHSNTSVSNPFSDQDISQNGRNAGQTNGQAVQKRGQVSHTNNHPRDEISPYAKNNVNAAHCDVMQMDETVDSVEVSTDVTLKTYLRSIVRMPRSMWVLCLCNLLCWMSLVCYSLYFTDFVGQAVYGGDPQAPVGSDLHNRYDDGVRLGSFGMSLYSLACACYSLYIEKLVQRFRAKRVYVFGQLVFTVGMLVMAVSRSKVAVILLSPTAGIMYATLFTLPYLLVAHYHTRGVFSRGDATSPDRKQIRGLGTDVAIISSMVFLAQFLLSVIMGTVVTAVHSTVTVVVASSVLSFLGAVVATQITYLDL